jgi:hypothetical protein
MNKRPRTRAKQVTSFRVHGGVIAEGVDPVLSWLEFPTASGEPVYDLRRTFELADGWYEFDGGITRDAVGTADFFPELNRPPRQRQHPRKALRRTRTPVRARRRHSALTQPLNKGDFTDAT